LTFLPRFREATTPTSIPSHFDSTPITHSSASQQGGEQTRKAVERKIFEEIRFCTYRDVEGFFEKYFEGKDWSHRASNVYKAMKDRHANGTWTGLPIPRYSQTFSSGGSNSKTTASRWKQAVTIQQQNQKILSR